MNNVKSNIHIQVYRSLAIQHLLEQGRNGATNTKEWRDLRIVHRNEVKLIGLMAFSPEDWQRQAKRVASLRTEQRLRLIALLVQQSVETLNQAQSSK